MRELRFAKGHGTGNDFVILSDPEDEIDLSPEMIRTICDRRFGIGGDGLLRLVMRDGVPFMDFRNADGSTAEMCGNGIRVFARYLVDTRYSSPGEVIIGTRAGDRSLNVSLDGDIVVGMGTATTPLARAIPIVSVGDRAWQSVGVLVPNPHAVAFVESLEDAGDLREAPVVSPEAVFPMGANVEFVVDRAPGHLAMRVHERGVGETQSCGTGACAVAWAARRRDGEPSVSTYRIDVPGGVLHVSEDSDGHLNLIGPAEIVAHGVVDGSWWKQVAHS